MSNVPSERLATERTEDKENDIILSLHGRIIELPVFQNLTVTIYTTRYSAHAVYWCVLCGSENEQPLFRYTTLTDCFYNRGRKCLLRGTDWIFKCNSNCY